MEMLQIRSLLLSFQVVFCKGVSPNIRKEVWPIILGVYKPKSSVREREQLKHELMHQYQAVNSCR